MHEKLAPLINSKTQWQTSHSLGTQMFSIHPSSLPVLPQLEGGGGRVVSGEWQPLTETLIWMISMLLPY